MGLKLVVKVWKDGKHIGYLEDMLDRHAMTVTKDIVCAKKFRTEEECKSAIDYVTEDAYNKGYLLEKGSYFNQEVVS